jgi:hypothetical protein
MKNVVLWDAKPCGYRKNRCFGESFASIIRFEGIIKPGTSTSKVPSLLILSTLMMEAIRSYGK